MIPLAGNAALVHSLALLILLAAAALYEFETLSEKSHPTLQDVLVI